MPLIKLSYPEDPTALLRQLPQGKFQWGDYVFAINDTTVTWCDYWVIYNDVLQTENVQCPLSHTLFMSGEPETVCTYPQRFLAQFYQVASCQPNIKHDNAVLSLTGQTWFIKKSFDELIAMSPIPKERRISVLCSNKQFTPGHKKRYQFVQQLKQHFGDQLDWFGRGVQDFSDKWTVLAPYQYSIAIENSVYDHYITEKITDCFLADAIPLYYGAHNVNAYYDARAMVTIDLEDLTTTVRTIERLLKDDIYYEKHLPYVREVREKYLIQYQLFPLLVSLCRELPQSIHKSTCKISPIRAFSVKKRIKTQLKKLWLSA